MTPLFKKLNYKGQNPVLITKAPKSFDAEIKEMAAYTKIIRDTAGAAGCGFIMAFVTQQKELEALVQTLAAQIKSDEVLWFCYPKKSAKNFTTDISRDAGWDALANEGFEPVRMVAVDADWSALRFRKVAFIKTMTRSTARSAAGKEKLAKTKNNENG